MSGVKTISGRGIPLRGDDIDTDRIIPARFLRCVTFEGLGAQVFADDRSQLGGQHPFDLPQYQDAEILIVNSNFGCGSSREHAPQAIIKWGIKAIIAESFAEIFSGNCTANGVPCLVAPPRTVKHLQDIVEANPRVGLDVSLEKLEVEAADFVASLSLAEGARQMLIEGSWDSCGQLVEGMKEIAATRARLPYLSWR